MAGWKSSLRCGQLLALESSPCCGQPRNTTTNRFQSVDDEALRGLISFCVFIDFWAFGMDWDDGMERNDAGTAMVMVMNEERLVQIAITDAQSARIRMVFFLFNYA